MDVDIIVAIVTSAGSLLGILFLIAKNQRSEWNKRRFDRQQSDQNRYNNQVTRINRYREPLIQSCLDLYNYLEAIFYQDKNGLETEHDKLEILYMFGQLFAWMEIVRRELIEFTFDDTKLNISIRTALGNVYSAFENANYVADNNFHHTYMEQRALGELMIDDKQRSCIEYTTFIRFMNDPGFVNWFDKLKYSLVSLELSVNQFDPSIYYKIQYGQLHAWTEDLRSPGLCAVCGFTKHSTNHSADVTAHFNRLYRIYLAIVNLIKTLDFEKKRVMIKKITTNTSQHIASKSWWMQMLTYLAPSTASQSAHEASRSVIVDRTRHHFVNQLISAHARRSVATDASQSASPTDTESVNTTIHSDSLAIELIELVLKFRSNKLIIFEKQIRVFTNITLSQFRTQIAHEFSEQLTALSWSGDQLNFSSIAVKLDMDIKLSQYGLRSGTIIYVTCPVSSSQSQNNMVSCDNHTDTNIDDVFIRESNAQQHMSIAHNTHSEDRHRDSVNYIDSAIDVIDTDSDVQEIEMDALDLV